MLLVTIIAFGLLLWLAWLQGRNLLFPPALFAAVWLVSLIGLSLYGSTFYPVPDKAYLVYIVGGVAFTLGGVFVLRLTSAQSLSTTEAPRWRGSPSTLLALDVLLVLVAAGLPIFWREISASVSMDEFSTLLARVREEEVLRGQEVSRFNIVLNLGGLANFIALAMSFETNGDPKRRWRAILAAALAVVYGGMAGAKIGSVGLVITLALIAGVRARRLKLSTIAASVVLALIFFSTGLVLINAAYESFAGSSELLQSLEQYIRIYWLSGLVAFGVIALDPNAIPSTQSIDRFFSDTARSLGANVKAPMYPEFTNVNLYDNTNVYTIYFSYFKDYGWIGTVVLMFIVGALMTLLYQWAMRGRPIAAILFAHLGFSVIVVSIVAETAFTGLNAHIKLTIFLVFLYRILPAFDAWRESALDRRVSKSALS